MNNTVAALSVLALVLSGLYLMTRGLPKVVLVVLGIVILSAAMPGSPPVRWLGQLVWTFMPLLMVIGFLQMVFRWVGAGRRK